MTHDQSSLDDIDLHIRTYRSLLKGSGSISVSNIIDSHSRMKPFLHEGAEHEDIDISSFIYAILRLPPCMSNVKQVVLGQSFSVFKRNSYGNISRWKEVSSVGRRRKMYYDGKGTLAVYVGSVSDVDDIITIITAFQIEWNKFHRKLTKARHVELEIEKLLENDDIEKIKKIWGDQFHTLLLAIKHRMQHITIHMLSGSYVEYEKATARWWDHIVKSTKPLQIGKRPVYFVSSNTHSIVNILTRFPLSKEKELIEYVYNTKNPELISLWESIEKKTSGLYRDHFLYYIAKKYAKYHADYVKEKRTIAEKIGINTFPASHYLDIDVQIIEVKRLAGIDIDARLHLNTKKLASSDAIIINIDYPLGWAAYQVLTQIGQDTDSIKGIYIMGKAATLNGQIGDIILPNTINDLHTKNTYVINNCISQRDFQSLFSTGAILDQQKTITVKGTYLQSKSLIEQWYKDGYTDIEMESGPYMNAAYEFVYYNRYQENTFINLASTPFELGIAHYASDTPYSKAKNLGARNLSYEGVEPTYAISSVIVKKILQKEGA